MKTSQIAAILVTLLISLVIVMWLASTAPSLVIDKANPTTKSGGAKPVTDTLSEEGVHKENPFTISEDGPHPKAVLEKTVHDFGTMAMGQVGSYDFVIKNEGEAPLKLAKGEVQCKCTVSGLKENEIPPGGEASIHLEWEPKSIGQFGQGAVIWTNDPESVILEIRVEGNMVTEINIIPESGWVLGPISSDKPTTFKGEIATAFYDSFEITSVETSSDNIKLKTEPMSPFELDQRELKVGYHLIGEYHPAEESGEIRGSVTVNTSLENKAKFVFNISGNRTGPLKIFGKDWVAGRQRLIFGRIDSVKGKTERLTLLIESSEKPLEVTDIQIQPAFVKVKVQAEENLENAKRQRHTLIIEVPAGSPKGIWTTAKPGKIVISTNHPKVKEISLNLVMTIQ